LLIKWAELFVFKVSTHNEDISFSFVSVLEAAKMSFKLLEVFGLPIKALQVYGLWPWKDSSEKEPLRVLVAILFQLFFASFIILQACKLHQLTDVREFSQLFAVMTSSIIVHLKTINLIVKMTKIKRMMKSLKELLQHDNWLNDCTKLKKNVQFIGTLYKRAIAFIIFSTTLNQFIQMLNHKLAYVMYMPEDANDMIFWVASIYQYVCACSSAALFQILDLLPLILIIFANGFYKQLYKNIEAEEDIQNKLKKFIEIESKIRAFVDKIDDCFSTMILIQAFLSSITLCMNSFILSHVSCAFQLISINKLFSINS